MFNSNSSATVTNCTFSGNQATNDGGGMHNYNGSTTMVTNCSFSYNICGGNGGGMYNLLGSTPTVTNCILWINLPTEMMNNGSTPTVSFSDVQHGLPADTIDGGGNINTDPFFIDADGADNSSGTADDDLRLQVGSPCRDAGNNAAVPAGVTTDLDGNGRVSNVTVDMGAYEFQDDGDDVPNDLDICPGFDDNGPDLDSDGTPDGCDLCPGFDDTLDSDSNGVPMTAISVRVLTIPLTAMATASPMAAIPKWFRT